MTENSDCFSCAAEQRPTFRPGNRSTWTRTGGSRTRSGRPSPGGWSCCPAWHVLALDEPTPAEAAGLGPVLRAVTAALREVTGCEKTYVALFAEAEGFSHVHFHVVPRHAGLAPGCAARECSG